MTDEIPDGFSPVGVVESPISVRQSVAWGDMDAFGHVNNAVYLRWLENVRMVYLEHIGAMGVRAQLGIGPILARVEVDYLAPVRYPDELWVSAQIHHVGNTSIGMRHRLWSPAQRALVARAESVLVMVDYEAASSGPAKVRVPEPVRAAIRALEGTGVEGTFPP